MNDRLGVGFVGAGFVTGFHIRSWVGVRDADVLGVASRTRASAEGAARLARSLGVDGADRHLAALRSQNLLPPDVEDDKYVELDLDLEAITRDLDGDDLQAVVSISYEFGL